MERKRTSSQRSAIVTDTKAEEQDTASKTLKLSLSAVPKLKVNTFLFEAHPNENEATVLSTLIRVTENDISVYCNEPLKAFDHINVLWKSFTSSEPICTVLLRILCQLTVKCTTLEEYVKEMLLHFITNKSPSVQSYTIDTFHHIAVHFTLEKEFHHTALNVAQEYINSIHHSIRASCLSLIGHVIPASSDQPSLVAMVSHCLADGDYRVRRAALEAMSTMVATGDTKILELPAYKEVSLLMYDDNEQVRIQAAKLLWRLGNLLGSNKITLKDSNVEINVLDDAFVKICDLMNDVSMKVRTLAAKLMGTFTGVTYKFLEQTLDKKLMSHLKHVKSDHERQRELFQSGGGTSNSMDWDSGKKWGQGIPQGGMVNKNEVVLMSQGACGAFVHGLEDEYMEVRKASMESICQLSATSTEFASCCLDFLVDMFNDEIEAVRLHSITCLCRVNSSNITLRDDQLEPVLNVLKDKSNEIREAVHNLLCSCHLTSTSGLHLTVNALLGNLSKYPQDKLSIWNCLKMIGGNHAHLTAALVPELLSTHPFFMTAEPDVDDPAYICVLVLIFNATQHCSTLPALFPSHVFRHYSYLNDALPDIVPQLNAMNCTISRSCDAATVKCQKGSSVTERFLSKTLDRINDLRSHDAHQTIETCISNLNQTASLDQTLSAPLHYVAMVCKCYLLLNKVKLALSQDIVLTTISPQRSVMATAVHNLQEVMSLSYQLQHCYQGQQAEMLCSIVQLRVITHAMQLLLAMQLNLDVSDSEQFMRMKESMTRRLLTISQFYATSGRGSPDALKVLLDSDIIVMSPDTLAGLLQPVINDDAPLCLQLSQLLPLRQAAADITQPSSEEGSISDDTTTFVASLALLLNVRALLYNVDQLNRVAVKVTFPDHRQLYYQPKPSEIKNISATTDSLQAAVVISHAAWTEPCQVEICIVQRLTMDSNEREADCLSTALSVNTATSPDTIAAKNILYGEALPLSKPVKLMLLPKSDL